MFSVVAFAFTKKPAVWSLDKNIEIKTMRTSIGLKLIDLSQHRFHSCKCKVCMIKDNLPVKNIVEDENHITLKINRFHINYFLSLEVHEKSYNWKACCLHCGNFQIEDRSRMFAKQVRRLISLWMESIVLNAVTLSSRPCKVPKVCIDLSVSTFHEPSLALLSLWHILLTYFFVI